MEKHKSILARLFLAAVLLFMFVASATFYQAYAPYTDDYSWILHCDYRFAHPGEWFTRGSTDYHINYPGITPPYITANFRPLTASFFYLASLSYAWTGYKSQLALNHILLIVIFFMYLRFLRRFTPLPPVARWMVSAIFLVSPVWSFTYFSPSLRVHLLECACTLAASLLLPTTSGGSLFRRVVPAAIISAGAAFAHELGIVAPMVVAWTHYYGSCSVRDSRKTAAREAFLILTISLGLYCAVRLALFQPPFLSAYHAVRHEQATSPVVGVLGVAIRLFFQSNQYLSGEALLGGRLMLIGWSIILFTVGIYACLSVGLLRTWRNLRDLRLLTGCAVIAAIPLIFVVVARHMCIVLIYCLPVAYLAVESVMSLDIKRSSIRPVGVAFLAGASLIYIGAGLESFLTARAYVEWVSRWNNSLRGTLVTAMKAGGRHLFLINDMSINYSSQPMLQLAARENGVTLVDPVVVNQFSVGEDETPGPAHETGVQVECRGGVLTTRIDLPAGRAFAFTHADPNMLLIRGNASGGWYEFPYMRRSLHRIGVTGSIAENFDFGSRLIFTTPVSCDDVGVVGFPGNGPLKSKIFFLGSQQSFER
jgi:hypothetical protein